MGLQASKRKSLFIRLGVLAILFYAVKTILVFINPHLGFVQTNDSDESRKTFSETRRNCHEDNTSEMLLQEGLLCQSKTVGCFHALPGYDKKPGAIVQKFTLMSASWCNSYCALRMQSYAGVIDSNTCVCAKDQPDFSIIRQPSEGCNTTCPGNQKETCGGKSSFSIYRNPTYCETVPLSDEYLESRLLGCFYVSRWENEFTQHCALSSKNCYMICNALRRPLAMYSDREGCLCGQMTKRFNLIHKLDHCGIENSLNVFRTAAVDYRCDIIKILPPRRSNRTMLTSFPGSGNTWIRYLLESATGFYTGSVYEDALLVKTGFIGEKLDVEDLQADIVKNHLMKEVLPDLEQIILIIRNPYHALVADFHRLRSGSHQGSVDKNVFDAGFEAFVKKRTNQWQAVVIKVLESNIPFKVFYFEDVVAYPIEAVRQMVEFLASPVLHPHNLEDRLSCLSQQINGENKRKRSKINYDPFTTTMKKKVNSVIKEVRSALRKTGVKTMLPTYEVKVEVDS